MGWYEDFLNLSEQIRAEYAVEADKRASYMVQEDWNRELLNKIATETGHSTLATTCFLEFDSDLNVRVYNDASVIEGLFHSKSSYHNGGTGGWVSISDHYSMSKSEFWDLRAVGEYGNGEYGDVDAEWLADNFWDGIYWKTNGWPLGDAEYLQTWSYKSTSALSIIKSYYNNYIKSNKYQKYVTQALKAMFS